MFFSFWYSSVIGFTTVLLLSFCCEQQYISLRYEYSRPGLELLVELVFRFSCFRECLDRAPASDEFCFFVCFPCIIFLPSSYCTTSVLFLTYCLGFLFFPCVTTELVLLYSNYQECDRKGHFYVNEINKQKQQQQQQQQVIDRCALSVVSPSALFVRPLLRPVDLRSRLCYTIQSSPADVGKSHRRPVFVIFFFFLTAWCTRSAFSPGFLFSRTAFLASSVLPAEQVSGGYNIRDDSDEVCLSYIGRNLDVVLLDKFPMYCILYANWNASVFKTTTASTFF